MGFQAPRRVGRMSARYCNDTEAEREHELKAFIPPEKNGDLVKRVGSVTLRRIVEGNPTLRAQLASQVSFSWIRAVPSGLRDLWRPFTSDPKVVQNHLGAVVPGKSCDIPSGMAGCAAQIQTA